MNGSEPSVVVENLTKRFGAFVAVDSITFQAHRGEIWLSRTQRRGQVHHHPDSLRPAPAHFRARAGGRS